MLKQWFKNIIGLDYSCTYIYMVFFLWAEGLMAM